MGSFVPLILGERSNSALAGRSVEVGRSGGSHNPERLPLVVRNRWPGHRSIHPTDTAEQRSSVTGCNNTAAEGSNTVVEGIGCCRQEPDGHIREMSLGNLR